MPKWLDNIVFYEIYPQTFYDSNGDGIGDLQGIIKKLDYVKELGCDGIWINPCFVSTFWDAGYDVMDYKRVAPRYGTNEDMRQLFEAAHERGMRVILDLVAGHTSIEHPWFKESCKDEQNPYTDRYIWSDEMWEDFSEISNVRSGLHGISERNACVGVNCFSTQPALNYGVANRTKPWMQGVEDPGPVATREAMMDVMRFWMGMGCDGFRVDMAGSLVKNDPDQQATIALWQKFRAFMDEEFPDAALISEWGDPAKSLQGGFHMDFLLHFGPSFYMDLFREKEPYFSRRGKGDISLFVNSYKKSYQGDGRLGNGLICIPSGNHDMIRIREFLDEEELKLAFAFLLSMPGAPFIYYGDEIGMKYVHGLKSKEGGYERTGSRTPMQWDHTTNAGFSSAPEEDLYLPIHPDRQRPTAEAAIREDGSLYQEIRKMIAIRKNHEALQSLAKVEFLYAEKKQYPFVYLRTGETERILVAINPSDQETCCEIRLPEQDGAVQAEMIYSNHGQAVLEGSRLTVPAASVTYIKL